MPAQISVSEYAGYSFNSVTAEVMSAAVLLASLSRSFWVGALAGGIVLLGWFVLKGRMRPFFNRLFTFVTLGVASVAWLYVLVALPIQGLQRASLGTLFSQRATKTSDIAIDSRKQLLPPLLSAFGEAPIQGHGLGKNVRYRTQDPKYIESHNTDLVSTYAFEWGWIDVLVKFGVVGTAMLLLVLILCVRELWKAAIIDTDRSWIYAAGMASVAALSVTHFFSPYLNHPIGWMTVAFLFAFIPAQCQATVKVEHTAQIPMPKRTLEGAVPRT